MPHNSEANIAIADTLTLLLHNQHATCAAIEEKKSPSGSLKMELEVLPITP